MNETVVRMCLQKQCNNSVWIYVFTYVAGKVKVEKPAKVERRIREVKKFEPINIDDYIQRLEGNLKLYVQQLQDET